MVNRNCHSLVGQGSDFQTQIISLFKCVEQIRQSRVKVSL